MNHTAKTLLTCLVAASAPVVGWARGVSPYLPLNVSPEIERQIERVLILADKPVTARPIAAATVLDALPAACRRDEVLCGRVRRYLDRYMRRLGLGYASLEAAAGDEAVPLPNRHGLSSDNAWRAAAQGYWQLGDYVIVSLGGVADEEDVVATGSMVSVGFDYAQLDVGYRDHWLSPFTDSAMIIGTQAQTLPSVTLSNYRPIGSLGLQYEVFLAEMEYSDRIRFEQGFTAGEPRLAGLRFSMSPAEGWSLSVNRMLQFGGGARGGRSLGDFFDALFKPHQNDNRSDTLSQEEEFGNQVAAWSSHFIFPGATPFAVYLEYAGEDSSYSGDFRLGNASLSLGINVPRLWQHFDLTYEASEWQNGWYHHGIYLDGLTQDGHVLGHWGADARISVEDAVGAQSHMVRLGWEPPFGGLMQLRARTIANEGYGVGDYERGYDVALSYSRTLRGMTAGAELMGGRDVFGDTFSRVAGFMRFGGEWEGGSAGGDWSEPARRPRGADLFVDAGFNASRVRTLYRRAQPDTISSMALAPHLALGARRSVSARSDLGVRLEVDQIEDELLLAVRALDYRYRFRSPLALSFFLGAARYDLATPAYGYYIGTGAQWREVLPGVDLSLDLRFADKVARDRLLPSDAVSTPPPPPASPNPNIFHDIYGATLSLSYRF